MTQRMYNVTTAVIFTVIGVVHLVRLILGWEAVVAEWPVPLWLSAVAALVAGYLAAMAFRLNRS